MAKLLLSLFASIRNHIFFVITIYARDSRFCVVESRVKCSRMKNKNEKTEVERKVS